MDILKAFKLINENYEINIQGTLDDPLFQANQIAKILDIKNISDAITDFNDDEKHIVLSDSNKGIQKTLFLTEIGLYRLLGRSRKPIAHIFQKWMIQTIKEIRVNGIYKLQKENEIDKKLIEFNCDLKNHKMLIKSNDNKNIVYICKLKEIDNKFIIKIGSSQSIKERMSHISSAFNLEQILLLDVIQSDNHTKFERFLHKNEFIKNYFHPMEMKDGIISKETYLVNDEQLEEILKICNNNKYEFENKDNKIIEELRLKTEELKQINEKLAIEKEKLSIEKETLKLKQKEIDYELQKNELEFKKLELSFNTKEDNYISDDDSLSSEDDITEDPTTCNNIVKKRKNGLRVPLVYQYDPNNLISPIHIFDSPADVERAFPTISPSPLKNSAKNNTIYKDFRWFFLNRNEELPLSIHETVETKHKVPEIRFLAMIDIKKTKIIEVFHNQKSAIEARNMKSNSFTRAIQQESISSGHYWKFFDDCSTEMKEEYLSRSVLPEKYVPKSGKLVQQIDPKTNKVIQTYNSNREIAKKFQMSIASLKNASETENVHKGYKWKICYL